MSRGGPLRIDITPSDLPSDPKERHQKYVDAFGEFIFWLRNWSLDASRHLIESSEAREALGTVRRRYYDGVAQLTPEQREAALLIAQETLDGLLQRLTWALGDEGTDARLGQGHAYRFRVEMEIVDVATGEVVEVETINRGGKFFGSYWGRWLNRFASKNAK